jgi:hypothetical protein
MASQHAAQGEYTWRNGGTALPLLALSMVSVVAPDPIYTEMQSMLELLDKRVFRPGAARMSQSVHLACDKLDSHRGHVSFPLSLLFRPELGPMHVPALVRVLRSWGPESDVRPWPVETSSRKPRPENTAVF